MTTPEDIRRYATTVKNLEAKVHRSHGDEDTLNSARFQLAVWACKNEGMPPTPDNVCAVLGPAAAAVRRWLVTRAMNPAPQSQAKAPTAVSGGE